MEPRRQAGVHMDMLRLRIDPFWSVNSPVATSIALMNQDVSCVEFEAIVVGASCYQPRGDLATWRKDLNNNVLPDRAWLLWCLSTVRTWPHVAGRNPSPDNLTRAVGRVWLVLCALHGFGNGSRRADVHVKGLEGGFSGGGGALLVATLSGALAAGQKF